MTDILAGPQAGRSPKRPLVFWIILAVLFAVVVAFESFALYSVFTSKFPGANDFFVRWLGGRAFLLEGINPFDRSVAESAQQAMFGRLAQAGDKDEAYFAYPLYTLFFFWPLSLLPYAWAQAIWMTLLQFMLLGITILSIRLAHWQPPTWLFWVTVFWGIFFYNGARAIILGQFSILVGLALLLALWAIENRQDAWAGVFLSITTIKPQMIFLVLVFLLLWALFQGRRRIILAFAASMAALLLGSLLLVPTWPLDFLNNAVAYSDYVAFGTPLENLLHYLLPASIAAPFTIILSLLFFTALLPGWWFALRGQRPGAYTWSMMLTLIVGSLITFRSATTNQVILYLPLFFFFHRLTYPLNFDAGDSSGKNRRADIVSAFIALGLALFMWGAFVMTIEGNWEHIMMHGVLPALLLILYAVDWRALWQTAAAVERGGQNQSGQVI